MLERENGRYTNTPETELFLDREKPSYVGGVLELVNAPRYPSWGSLTESLRTGTPASGAERGKDFFEGLYADPAETGVFVEGMAGASYYPAPATTSGR